MTPAKALTLAPEGAHLVARPASTVAHVYVGPLTRSRCYVPRAARPTCGARTRRLSVLQDPPFLVARRRRMCVCCSARIVARRDQRSRDRATTASPALVGPAPVTREAMRAAFADLTPHDVIAGAVMAETLEEIERVELLALLVIGHPRCAKEKIPTRRHRDGLTVDEHIREARTALGLAHDDTFRREHIAGSRERARAIAENERLLTREAKQRAIDVHGYTRARELERQRPVFIDGRADTG